MLLPKKTFHQKTILITGGTGSIGSEIVRQIYYKYNPKEIRIFSRDESKQFHLENELEKSKLSPKVVFMIGDIRDKDRLREAIIGVDIIFHVAALKHVPYCERNSYEAIKTNILGTQNLIDLAIENNVNKVIAISTDKAVDPNTLMGVTKLLMERQILSSMYRINQPKTIFSIVRFGNVLNSRGSIVPLWMDQINKGHDVTVTDKNMRRFFMTIPEAVSLIFIASSMMKGQETFVLKMPEKNIYQFAQETIKKYAKGKKIKIKIIGARDREKIIEYLYTNEEKKLMIQKDKFYIILPNKELFKKRINSYKN
jgi:FlaA1/EpsC-like NDP-sugar epimerase